ncbi:MAG: glycosyltransferase [Prochloraceae cyanobacterium]
MKIALVHDYLTQKGGAERVFELLCKFFPDADVYTSLYDPQRSINLKERSVKTTMLQKIPGATKYFRLLAPLYYPAFRSLDFKDYDLILSSTTSFAKAVKKRAGATHICFCHNVTRFLWDTKTYLKQYSDYQKLYPQIEKIFRVMREYDLKYAQEPDIYIANSTIVADRIRKTYDKQAVTINYPIDSSKFNFEAKKDNYYLVASRLLGYKRVEVTVKAFNKLGWPLIIIGDGPERNRLEAIAKDNIKFLGHVEDAERKRLMAKAKSVIVSALEDYGLVPIEANASGTPVISYGAGGVLDTQVPGKTGVFFKEQTPEALAAALIKASKINWNYHKIRTHAIENFSEQVFFKKIEKIVDEVYLRKTIETINERDRRVSLVS